MRIPALAEGDAGVILASTPPSDGVLSMDLYARDLCAAFDRVLPEFRYVLLRPGAPGEPWLQRQCFRYFGYPKLLRQQIRARRASIVHILDQSGGHLCRIPARTVVTCHDIAELKVSGLTVWQLKLWEWRVQSLRRASRVVAISHNTARDLQDMLGIPPQRIVVSHSGVSGCFKPRDSPPESDCAKRLLALRGHRFLFLHVGVNHKRKNIPCLLRAFSILKRRHPAAMLVKVGAPFSQDESQRTVQELGIGTDVMELGRISDQALVEVYQSVDCLVLPSLYEGFGRPVVEAQACGVPCILAKSSSLEEVGGNAALYHEPSNPEDLANKMGEVITRAGLRSELAARGISNAARFSCDNHARTLLDVYSCVRAEAIDSGPPLGPANGPEPWHSRA